MHSATQLNYNLNSFKIFALFFDVLKNLLPCISLNARNYLNYAFSYAFNFEIISRNKNSKSNYGEKFAYTLEIKTERNSTYAILSYGDEVKAKLTGGANKSKYELDDKYTFLNRAKLLIVFCSK